MINGPSVGLKWKYKAATSSLKYVDYLNFSFEPIYNFLYISYIFGASNYYYVYLSNLTKS